VSLEGVLFFGILVVVLALSLARWALDSSYREFEHGDPIKLCDGLMASVDHPKMLSLADQGSQQEKRAIINLWPETEQDAQPIWLTVKPESPAVRFLDKEGQPVSGHTQLTLTHGISIPLTLYLEHTQAEATPPFGFSVSVLPPSLNITQTHLAGTVFEIDQEPDFHQALRQATQAIPSAVVGLAGLVSLLAFSGNYLWQQRARQRTRLEDIVPQADAIVDIQENLEDARRVCREYRELRWPKRSPWVLIGNAKLEVFCSKVEAAVLKQEQEKLNQELAEKREQGVAQTLDALDKEDIALFEERLRQLQGLEGVSTELLNAFHRIQELDRRLATRREAGQWYFAEDLSIADLVPLFALLQERRHPVVLRRRLARLIAHHWHRDAKLALEEAWDSDPDIAVQAEAAWGLLREPRDRAATLETASPETVNRWLQELSRLQYNPFAVSRAEYDDRNDQHFVGTHAYAGLVQSEHAVVFGEPGSGVTSLRLQLERDLSRSPKSLAIRYKDFGWWLSCGLPISPLTETHLDRLVLLAASLFNPPRRPIEIAPPNLPPFERLVHLVHSAVTNGFPGGVTVLVDCETPEGEAAVDPRLLAGIVRHLLDAPDLLRVPGLQFKFLLPSSVLPWRIEFSSIADGLVEPIEIQWSEGELINLLEQRILQASQGSISSLKPLIHDPSRISLDWDQTLVEYAQGSPRRLIEMANRILQHRARQWERQYDTDPELGRSVGVMMIRPKDWACFLEWLIQNRPS
jgi:hypothetical protein